MIARFSCIGLVAGLLFTAGLPTTADAGEREEVVDYLRKNVIGRTLETRITEKIAQGKVETEFASRRTFSNLVETSAGLAFDETIVINQVLYDLDEHGKRVSPGRNKDRVIVMRHEYSVRQSTGRLLGISRVLSASTNDDLTGFAEAERITVKGDSLLIQVTTIGYEDFFAPGGKYEPTSTDWQDEFSVQGGKLRCVTKRTSYNVDPETLKRTVERIPLSDLIGTESP